MTVQVTMGATMMCSQGLTPSTLVVPPINKVFADNLPAATVMDKIPIVNIPPFGMCRSMSNPTVSAATSAAMGVLTPMPCIPLIAGPWKPGSSSVKIANKKALTKNSKCKCAWGGNITLINPGGRTVKVK